VEGDGDVELAAVNLDGGGRRDGHRGEEGWNCEKSEFHVGKYKSVCFMPFVIRELGIWKNGSGEVRSVIEQAKTRGLYTFLMMTSKIDLKIQMKQDTCESR
jgi:hypothetical protein